MDFTIQRVLVPLADGYQVVDVQVQAGRISAIAPRLEPVGVVIPGQNKLLLPGFVNAHTHSPEMWQRGRIAPLPLELWLAELYDFPLLSPEKIYLSALGTAVETLYSGGTTVVDHLILLPGQELDCVAAAIRAYREVGIRAFVAPLLQDQSLMMGLPVQGKQRPTATAPRTTEAAIDVLKTAIEQFHDPDAGIFIMAAPTGLQLCSDALMEAFVEIGTAHDLCFHSHLLETKAQKLLAYEKYGCSAVEHLKRLNFLGPKTSLAHCVWLDDADIELLADTHSTVVHNPLSNLRLGSGIAPVLKYRVAGVNTTFGCDGASSNDSQDLLEAIKLGAILHNLTDFEYQRWITPQQAIEMASLGGVTGLGLQDQLGSLEVGKLADLVLYDLTCLSLLPRTDPIGLLVLGRPTQAVDSVWIKGDRVVANGSITTIDVSELRRTLFEQSQWSLEHKSVTRSQIESHYRAVMQLE
ncbi:MAG: amidohydrolase [Leptolyngbyaceae cyanobacterium bins.302]|nr:amidohydrolase [Leptolyngbyaceae cyanobacterium bins.302]